MIRSAQNDGKIVVKGSFTYLVNGQNRESLVRLNSDGNIDPTFLLGTVFNAPGRFDTYSDDALLLGTKRESNEAFLVPLKLTPAGERDTTFTPNLYPQETVTAYDVRIQPDGKIVVGGTHSKKYFPVTNTTIYKGFLTRLNPDGSSDGTFQ